MKYAVKVNNEFDRENVIRFFEMNFENCNKQHGLSHYWRNSEPEIGDIFFIDQKGKLGYKTDKDDLSDYTILDGVPENGELPKSVFVEFDKHKEFDNKTEIEGSIYKEIDQVKTREQELEEENKELISCLGMCIMEIESLYKRLGYSNSNILDKAKKLLNK